MIILVDTDNIAPEFFRKGANFIVDKILNSLGYSALLKHDRVRIRFYGGWYENTKITTRAVKLGSELSKFSPNVFNISEGGKSHKYRVNTELAFSIEAEPAKHFWYTFRTRNIQRGLRCESPVVYGCDSKDCPIRGIDDFINTGICPSVECSTKSESLIFRNDQKLVDTMLTADLIHLSLESSKPEICLVTSDDDFWPGIRTALIYGCKIYHIHPISDQNSPAYYSSNLSSKYCELNW